MELMSSLSLVLARLQRSMVLQNTKQIQLINFKPLLFDGAKFKWVTLSIYSLFRGGWRNKKSYFTLCKVVKNGTKLPGPTLSRLMWGWRPLRWGGWLSRRRWWWTRTRGRCRSFRWWCCWPKRTTHPCSQPCRRDRTGKKSRKKYVTNIITIPQRVQFQALSKISHHIARVDYYRSTNIQRYLLEFFTRRKAIRSYGALSCSWDFCQG